MTPDEVHEADTRLRRLYRAREHIAAVPEDDVGQLLVSIVQDNRLPIESLRKLSAYARGLLVDHHSTEIERMTRELRAMGVEVSK